MEEERFVDRLKRAGGCVWFLFAGFIIAGLFLIIAGSLIYAANRGTTDGSIAIICVTLAFAIKELLSMNRELSYRVEDDCVVDSQVKKHLML